MISYGLGFYYIDVNNPKLQGLFQTTKLLRDEYGFEAFYNFAITPWLTVTPDIQVVRGAQKNKFTLSPLPAISVKRASAHRRFLDCACRWFSKKCRGMSVD